MQGIPFWYVGMSGDPLVGRAMGIVGNGSDLAWFKSFLYLEAYDHVPVPLRSAPRLIADPVVFFNFLCLSSVSLASGEVSCVSIVHASPTFSCIMNCVPDSPGIYSLLALYGASTATTTLACIAMIIDTPLTSAATFAQKVLSITSEQRVLLLSSYVPFFIIPLCIGVDMAFRLHKLASAGIRAQECSKEE